MTDEQWETYQNPINRRFITYPTNEVMAVFRGHCVTLEEFISLFDCSRYDSRKIRKELKHGDKIQKFKKYPNIIFVQIDHKIFVVQGNINQPYIHKSTQTHTHTHTKTMTTQRESTKNR